MQVYISFGILIIIVALFCYILFLARRLKKQRIALADEQSMHTTQIVQSRAEITVFGMIGMLIIDYALTFPEKSSTTFFFFYGRTGLVIGAIIVAIAIISFIFPTTAKAPISTEEIPS